MFKRFSERLWIKRAHRDIIDALEENNAIDEASAIDLMDIFLDKENVDKYAHDLFARKIIGQTEDNRYYLLPKQISKKDHLGASEEKG